MTFRHVAVVLALFGSALAAQNRMIVRTTPAAVDEVAKFQGLRVVGNLDGAAKQVYVMEAPDENSGALAIARLKLNPAVQNVEADARVTLPEAQLNQSTVAILDGAATAASHGNRLVAYSRQPAFTITALPQAQTMATGAGIVAVIDTGIDEKHPVLAGFVIPGYDFTRNSPGPASDIADLSQSTVAILDQSTVAILDQSTVAILDQSTVAILDQSTVAILDSAVVPKSFGHGTMVAGLIHLAAPTAKIMPLKAFSADGTAKLSDIVRAIYYAADAGAKVINMSFSMDSQSQELKNAINYANSKRTVMVSSVANAGSSAVVYPAASNKVLGVASTTNYDARSTFSNYGDDVSLAAPGEALITTFPFNRYAVVWGTSFSTGLVSGTTALIAQVNGRVNQAQAAAALSNAVPLPGQGLGWGRLNASWALTYVRGTDDRENEQE